MDIGIEERRVAIEAIATLVNIKNVLADLILKPAGVPAEIYQPLLYRRDDVTGRPLSKRRIAPLILEALDRQPGGERAIRKIVEITAQWSSFHLAADEYVAQAVVLKAQNVLGTIERFVAQEAENRERDRRAESEIMKREQAKLLHEQSILLLLMFDELGKSMEPQKRGFLFQDLFTRILDLYEIPIVCSFTRNQGGEQIDGAFKLDGWHYLVECRWREKVANAREIDGLQGQVNRSGRQTMGLFLSIHGWSENVIPLLKQNPEKSIVLMDGYDLRTVLSGGADLRDFLLAKVAKLNLEGEPYLSARHYRTELGQE